MHTLRIRNKALSMTLLALLIALVTVSPVIAATKTSSSDQDPEVAGLVKTVRVYMPDGQLKSHMVRIYVSKDIQSSQNPRLRLLQSHAVTKKAVDEARLLEPGLVAPGQEWQENIAGSQVRRSGTLLLFDLNQIPFNFKAVLRVLPVVSWIEDKTEHLAAGESEVNIANIVAAICWTVMVVGLAFGLVVWLALKGKSNPLLFLAGADGHLSLARTQVVCWTLAVGGVVLGYGFIRLDIPDIPASLLVLMGASLTTGGVGYFKDAQKHLAKGGALRTQTTVDLHWPDLVRVFTVEQQPELSLAKAQMLFWTLLLLVLFMSKSILEGAIWEVPWPLVALMGFSQAGYLASKMTPEAPETPAPKGGNVGEGGS